MDVDEDVSKSPTRTVEESTRGGVSRRRMAFKPPIAVRLLFGWGGHLSKSGSPAHFCREAPPFWCVTVISVHCRA